MNQRDWLARLYVLNSALLFTHEIDSGFWREWELFRLPGGVSGFLAANFALIVVTQLGFRSVVLRKASRRLWAVLLATAGIVAAVVHGAFLAAGTSQFGTATSMGLLATWFAGSILQFAVIRRQTRETLANTAPAAGR
jgi:uncharacterized protein DUF6713